MAKLSLPMSRPVTCRTKLNAVETMKERGAVQMYESLWPYRADLLCIGQYVRRWWQWMRSGCSDTATQSMLAHDRAEPF